MNSVQAARPGLAAALAHLHGEAGVFCATSADGVRWSRPVRLIASVADPQYYRTRDYPGAISI